MTTFIMSEWTTDGWARVQKVVHASAYDYSDDFLAWLYKNNAIWLSFVATALTANKGSHKQRFGAKAILEVLRWESFLTDSEKTFKINNNRAPDLARLVMDCKPELRGYFQIRGSAYRGDAPK